MGVVRERDSGALLEGTQVRLVYHGPDQHWTLLGTQVTNPSGGFCFNWSNGAPLLNTAADVDALFVIAARTFANGTQRTDTVPWSRYLSFSEVYLDDPAPAPLDTFKVADMHYHITMRAQDGLGQDLYDGERNTKGKTDNVLWNKSLRNLKVMVDGEWCKVPRLSPRRMEKIAGNGTGKRTRKLRALFTAAFADHDVHPAKANNGMVDFSQTTLPSMRSGHVFLGFDAISPFEHNLNDSRAIRWVSENLKSGVDQRWLARIGSDKIKAHPITHWENFNMEYQLLRAQGQDANNFRWRLLKSGADMEHDTVPTIVAVIEGGHTLQHTLFPNNVNYDLEHRTDAEQKKIVERMMKCERQADTALLGASLREVEMLSRTGTSGLFNKAQAADVRTYDEARAQQRDLVDRLMMDELDRNIRDIKARNDPAVKMVTVSHLSYNGMTGHAVTLDDGQKIAKLLAQKVYNIRVSEDKSYLVQWQRLFFTVPGPNKFGKYMLREMQDSTTTGHRIRIDLKHSDLVTRRFYYDSLMVNGHDTIPPICSHCAVTGLSGNFYSPFNNEYAILRAPFTTTFYPFGINLYDEEILRIHRHKGIIGLPLEQRVLGGYINTRGTYVDPLRADGRSKKNPKKQQKRYTYMRRYFTWRKVNNDPSVETTFNKALASANRRLNSTGSLSDNKKKARALDLLREDYVSAEPFMQNLFYIVDRIWNDSLRWHDKRTPRNMAYPWQHVCIGSDLDGIIDPIDICATADMYPSFHDRLRELIPIFLEYRKKQYPRKPDAAFYFRGKFDIDQALYWLFYGSLKEFTRTNF